MLPQIPLLQLSEYKLEQFQKNVVQPLNKLLSIPFLDGRLIKSVTLTSASPTRVETKLARKYLGWFLTNIDANANVWVSSTTDSDKYLTLNTSANCVVDIWVF